MKKHLLTILFIFSISLLFAQADSADVFLQKGLLEKKNGRRMESLKNFEKAYKYNSSNKAVVAELASAYYDLRKYGQARETYKKLVDLGEGSATTFKQLMLLSFNMRQYDDAILYANKLKQVDDTEKVNYYIVKAYYEQENYVSSIQYLNAAMTEEP